MQLCVWERARAPKSSVYSTVKLQTRLERPNIHINQMSFTVHVFGFFYLSLSLFIHFEWILRYPPFDCCRMIESKLQYLFYYYFHLYSIGKLIVNTQCCKKSDILNICLCVVQHQWIFNCSVWFREMFALFFSSKKTHLSQS